MARSAQCYLFSLGRMPNDPDAVVPALIARLADDSFGTRLHAIQALGAFGAQARAAIPDLLQCLSDPQVRGLAIIALHRIDPTVETQVAPPTK